MIYLSHIWLWLWNRYGMVYSTKTFTSNNSSCLIFTNKANWISTIWVNFRTFISFEAQSKNRNKNLNTIYMVLPNWNERTILSWYRHIVISSLISSYGVHEYMHPIFIHSLVQQIFQQLLHGKCELIGNFQFQTWNSRMLLYETSFIYLTVQTKMLFYFKDACADERIH